MCAQQYTVCGVRQQSTGECVASGPRQECNGDSPGEWRPLEC